MSRPCSSRQGTDAVLVEIGDRGCAGVEGDRPRRAGLGRPFAQPRLSAAASPGRVPAIADSLQGIRRPVERLRAVAADLIQEGRIGLWQAIQYFDPERGTPFASYAWLAIQHRVWRARFYADRVEDDKNEEVESWLELVNEIEEDWWRGQVRQALLEVVGKLPTRLGRLICLTYGLNGQGWYSLAAIGRQWGISRERARQLHNDALTLLRLPALSMRLRSLCERDSRLDYQQAQQLNRVWLRNRRGR